MKEKMKNSRSANNSDTEIAAALNRSYSQFILCISLTERLSLLKWIF